MPNVFQMRGPRPGRRRANRATAGAFAALALAAAADDVVLDFESAGALTANFRPIGGAGTATQTDPAADEPDNDTLHATGAAILLYDATPGDGAATRTTFALPFSVVANVRFGVANQSFGVYVVHPSDETQALLALLNADYSASNDQFRFSSNGVPPTGGAGSLIQTLAAESGVTTSGAFHRIEIGCATNSAGEPVLSLWAGTAESHLTLTGTAAHAAAQVALRFSAGSGVIDVGDIAIRSVRAPAPADATNSGSRLVRRLAAGDPQKVVVYGTSLTAAGAWPGQMRDWLTNTYAGALTLVNSGLSGKNSRDGVENLDAKVLAYDPDVVFLEFAMNDAFTNYADAGYNLVPAQARSNLVQMIDRILAHNPDAEIILQTMNPATDSAGGNGTSATMRPGLPECYQIYRDVAAERGLLLVDHYPNWKTLQLTAPATFQTYAPDGLHPGAAGLAAVTLPLLKERLVGVVGRTATNAAGPVRIDADVCVYGGTSAGVAAAVEASRLGKSCVLVSPVRRLGGLTSSGLGWTDYGNRDTIGGFAREFYRRVYLHYLDASAWSAETRDDYLARSTLDPDDARRMMFTFEPGVAAALFNDFLAEARVPVVIGRLRRPGGGTADGASLRELTTDDGRTVVRAAVFIDASYEADLMAEAGVPFRVGREAASEFGESLNGIQTTNATAHQFAAGVSPYVVEGNPGSGLLPGVSANAGGADGAADGRLQAYNYRMCLTSIASNLMAVAQPEGYREAEFELLFRALAASQTVFFSTSAMPNRKTDSNNSGGFSTDLIGGNYDLSNGWTYADAGYAMREQVEAAHRRHQQGLLWTLQNSTNVPAAVRASVAGWGLPLDEFDESGHWPPLLYVREARRMAGDFVMTQRHVNQDPGFIPTDPVGLGSYTMDSHHVQRHVAAGGMLKNEGDVQKAPARGPYGIAYRALVPPSNSVQNLLVPVALSATHIAFGSIRMEPVFMILGQSAGAAAAQAIDDGVPVQQVDYERLRLRLLAAGQVLSTAAAGTVEEVIVDSDDTNRVTIAGDWTASAATTGYWGTNYIHDGNAGKGTKSVTYAPVLAGDGTYTVQLRWTVHSNRATNVPVDLVHAGGTNTVTVNQQANGGAWVTLLTTNFTAAGARVIVRNGGTTGYVIADAVRFTRGQTELSVVADDAVAGEQGGDSGRFAVLRGAVGASPLTVAYTVDGTATAGTDYAALPGRVTIPAGASSAAILVRPVADAEAEGDETVRVTLTADAAFTLGGSTSAVVTIRDRPRDGWRFARFTAAQRADPLIGGDAADPDRDGRPNALEYALGSNPWEADATAGAEGRMTFEGGALRFMLEYDRGAEGVQYAVEKSAALGSNDWSAAGVSDEIYLPDRGRFGRYVMPAPADRVLFLRLTVRE